MPFHSPGDLPNPGIEPISPALAGRFFTTEPPVKPISFLQFSSVQFSRSVMSDSLGPHKSQHARPPCLSPTPGVYSYSCPLSQWCDPTISSSVVPFSSCPRPFPSSGSFPLSQLFAMGLGGEEDFVVFPFPTVKNSEKGLFT